MKSVLVSLMIALSLSSASALEIGEKIKSREVKMQNVDSKMISIADIKGPKGTVVIFTCNHCPYAKKWHERLTKFGNEYKGKGLGIIAINSNDSSKYQEDSLDEMKKLAAGKSETTSLKMMFPYVVDSTSNVARAFGAEKTPEFFVFNAKDELVYHGAFDGDADDPKTDQTFLKTAADELLAGKKISQSKTSAFGCGIKFRKAS